MLVCPSCGTDNASDPTFCSRMRHAPARTWSLLAKPAKTVTVLFCDLAGSTSLGERLDPESLGSAIERYFDRMGIVLESHGRTVEKFIGDAIMAVFGVPQVHDDDALRAVRAACDMREALMTLNQELEGRARHRDRRANRDQHRRGGGRRSRRRSAVGDGRRGQHRRASRAGRERRGDPDRRAHVRPGARRGRRGARRPARPEEQGRHRRSLSAALGAEGRRAKARRPDDRARAAARTLLDAFEGVVADRACHLFTVLGPAGSGKSRLVREFGSRIEGRAALLTGALPVLRRGHHVLAHRRDGDPGRRDQGGRSSRRGAVALGEALGDAPRRTRSRRHSRTSSASPAADPSKHPGRSGGSSRRSRSSGRWSRFSTTSTGRSRPFWT
jgi:hypothetical protein